MRALCSWVAAMAIAFSVTPHARANAPTGRYTISNGTVFDNRTKLTWQQMPAGATLTWSDAKAYCGGVWRLPTAKELATLVDETG